MHQNGLEAVLERLQTHTRAAVAAADLGEFGEAYRCLHLGGSIITSVFGDDFVVIADDPFDAVMREYLRAEERIHQAATSETGVAAICTKLRAAAGALGSSSSERRWGIHDGALGAELARETAIYLAVCGTGKKTTLERFMRGKWLQGPGVSGILLVAAPAWLYGWMSAVSPEATGVFVAEEDPETGSYIKDLWRDDRDNKYFDIRAVHRAARGLRAAGRKERREKVSPSIQPTGSHRSDQ